MTAHCCDRVYLCDGEIECPVHGGFDVCCDRPDLHRCTRHDNIRCPECHPLAEESA